MHSSPEPFAGLTVVQTVELTESAITNEIDEARSVARRCFRELGDPVFFELQEIDIKAPRVIRIPPGQRSR